MSKLRSRTTKPTTVYGTYVASPHYENLKLGLKTGEGRCEDGMRPGMRKLKAGDYFSIRHGLYGCKETALLMRIVRVQRFKNLQCMYESQTAGVVYIPDCSNFTAFKQVYTAYGDSKRPWTGYQVERTERISSLETKPLQSKSMMQAALLKNTHGSITQKAIPSMTVKQARATNRKPAQRECQKCSRKRPALPEWVKRP